MRRGRPGTLAQRERYRRTRPRSAQLFADARHLFGRVPMTWMGKWSGGFPVYLDRAAGNRVVDDGVLEVVGVTDPVALGFPVMAMVAVSAVGDVRVVADRISGIENVIYLVLTSGEHDLLAEVVCRSPEELLEVVNDRIRAVPGVQGTRVW